MSEESLLPFCSNCGCSIADFSACYQVPCHHLYCDTCINTLCECPIDNQMFGSAMVDQALEREVEDWKVKRSDSRRKAIYELINVNDVKCRIARKHDLTKCVYDHYFDSVYLPEFWHCTYCDVNVDSEVPSCPFCNRANLAVPAAHNRLLAVLAAIAVVVLVVMVLIFF